MCILQLKNHRARIIQKAMMLFKRYIFIRCCNSFRNAQSHIILRQRDCFELTSIKFVDRLKRRR